MLSIVQMACNRLRCMVFPPICPLCLSEAVHDKSACGTCRSQLSIIQGKICSKCGGPLITDHGLCRECTDNPRIWWQSAVSAFCFDGLARSAVHRFKYHGDVSLVPLLAHECLSAWKSRCPDTQVDCVVPVPLHWLRKMVRGYNQSEVVSKVIAEQLGVPMLCPVKRARWTPPQAKLSKSKRGKNLKNAFTIASPERVKGKVILLFDDVMTTGATLSECSRSLIKAGAKEVYILTIARRL